MSRFDVLAAKLAAHGAHDPTGLAAYIGRKKYGHAAFQAMATAGRKARRSRQDERGPYGPIFYDRTFRLDDIAVRSGGDGRTVEAYAAVFDTPAEIRDQHGHYMEQIDRKSFNRQLGLGIERVGVYYHHGMTLHGTPSDVYSVPIGRPLEIRADGRGLRTVTRYNDGPDADRILEAINNDAIRGYSFRGPIYSSNPDRIPRRRAGAPLPLVTRTALGLTEYGPTPMPAYESAGILAVRSATELLQNLPDDDRDLFKAEIIRILLPTTPTGESETNLDEDEDEVSRSGEDQEATTATPEGSGTGAEDQPAGHSGRQLDLARRINVELLTRSHS